MSKHKNLKIVAFVGLAGSYVGPIVQYLTEHGIPKVTRQDIVSQIHHLADAGQHRIVTDELDSLDLYKTMKHEFPGELIVIGLVTDRDVRHHRVTHQNNALEDDWNQNQTDRATVLGMADHYIEDTEDEPALQQKVTALLDQLGFYA